MAATPVSDAELAAGEAIGRFEVVRLLGRGGFGVVYAARDRDLGRMVAVKLLRLDRDSVTVAGSGGSPAASRLATTVAAREPLRT